MLEEFKAFYGRMKQTSLLMVGLPDYDAYVEHRQRNHPDQPVMTYEDFFRERQLSRYSGANGRIGRCC